MPVVIDGAGGRAVAVAVHPFNDDLMIVASETGGLFRTTDGGNFWQQVSGSTTFDFTDVQYLPSDPTVVVASARRDFRTVSGGGIWRSTDGGISWHQATLDPPTTDCADAMGAYAVSYEAERNRLWAGTECGAAFSDDEGANWTHIPTAPGYNNDKVIAIETPDADNLKILTPSGVKVTDNGGASWSLSLTGLPDRINKRAHNQISLSPRDQNHIFWAFSRWRWDDAADRWKGSWSLYLSTDNGSSWNAILDTEGLNRPAWVRIAESLSGESEEYDIYLSNGGCAFQRATATHGSTPTLSAWTSLTIDHCDTSDVGFSNDGKTPLLVTSDGGLHMTEDAGLNWSYVGANGKGYNALQITEVTGQKKNPVSGRDLPDLYFGTQDNNLWASADYGSTWSGSSCCEGFYINVEREFLPPGETKITGVRCGGCRNFLSDALFVNGQDFPNPPDDAGNPALIKPGAYVHRTVEDGETDSVYQLTEDTGGTWATSHTITEPPLSFPLVVGSDADPSVFTAVKRSGATPDGLALVGLKKATGLFAAGGAVLSDVPRIGGIGTFPTMFAWYEVFGVDPADPDFIIIPDIVEETVRVTTNGGLEWNDDTDLRDLVTQQDAYQFRRRQFTQISSFGFDPDCDGHFLVGTRQTGIFQSFDHGGTWRQIPRSDLIPYVSSFFFPGDTRNIPGALRNEAIISSYGRGLWKLRYACPGHTPIIPPIPPRLPPWVFYGDAITPLLEIDPTGCPRCRLYLAQGGQVTKLELDPGTGNLKGLGLSGGQLAVIDKGSPSVFDMDMMERQTTGEIRKALGEVYVGRGTVGSAGTLPEGVPKSPKLQAYLKSNQELAVRGVYTEDGIYKGVVVAESDVTPDQWPRVKESGARLYLAEAGNAGLGIGRTRPVSFIGVGFDPKLPIKITLDGAPVDAADDKLAPRFDDRGRLRITIPPIPVLGGHTILVSQVTPDGTVRDAYTFNVTVQDFPGGDEERLKAN